MCNAVPVSIDRRGQDVRYALLAPLPLAFRRAELSALTGQAPGPFWTLKVRAAVVVILGKRFCQRACRVTFARRAAGATVGNELLRPNRRATIFSFGDHRKPRRRKPYPLGSGGKYHGGPGGTAAAVRSYFPPVILWFLSNHLERNPPHWAESSQRQTPISHAIFKKAAAYCRRLSICYEVIPPGSVPRRRG